jgi:hypothetical protein
LPHADHGAMFGQAVFHGGDDLFGKRDLRNLSALFLGCPAYLIARNGGGRSSAHGAAVPSGDFEAWQTRADVMKRRRRSDRKHNRQRLAADARRLRR